jgi:phosphoribosylglycinamide formyltransferase-1
LEAKIKIGVLISGSGTNLQAIIDSCESGAIFGDIVFVGSDYADAYGLERAKKHHIPTFVVDYRSVIQQIKNNPEKVILPNDFNLKDVLSKQSLFPSDADPEKVKHFMITRAVAEASLIDSMKPYPFDLLLLAGFMRNLTPYFIDKINQETGRFRIMNIHPALLPAFPGADGYGDTFRYGCKVGGCTVHFVDYGEDTGPIIGQKAFQIEHNDTLSSIKEKGLAAEWELYPECIELFARKRLKTVQKEYISKQGEKSFRTVIEIQGC